MSIYQNMTRPLVNARKGESSLDPAVDAIHPGEPKQAWVYRQLRTQILKGALCVGARLPSTRSLAQRWHISRATVEVAYDQLRSEGYLVSTVGSGTYVAAVIPDSFFKADKRGTHSGLPASQKAPIGEDAAHAPLPFIGRYGQPFVARVADPALFPLDSWRKLLLASAKRVTPQQLSDDDPQGWLPLREQIARYLGVARGIACGADQIVVLTGIRHGLDLSARLLLRPGDKVLVEDPGYMHAMPIFGQYTRRVVPIPVDPEGFSVARARRHRGVRLVHVTPAHQAPLGFTMPVSRRLELLAWAKEADCWLIEDDYDSEFSYDSAPLPALKSLDVADRVIHCGSFNKTLFAGLRIGYAVVPRQWIPAFTQAMRASGHSNSVLEQMALCSLLENGAFARHVRKARAVYAQRRDAVLHTLGEAVGKTQLKLSGEQCGFHFVWWPPAAFDVARFLSLAEAQGLQFENVADFCHRVKLPPGLAVGFSALPDAALHTQLARLRGLIHDISRCGERVVRPQDGVRGSKSTAGLPG